MNTSHAAGVLEAAASVTIRIDGSRSRLDALTPNQAEGVKASRQRSGTWSYARRYFKLLESVGELEKLHKGLGPLAACKAPPTPRAALGVVVDTRGIAPVNSNDWTAVPYVITARPDTPVLESADDTLGAWMCHHALAYVHTQTLVHSLGHGACTCPSPEVQSKRRFTCRSCLRGWASHTH